MTCSRFSWETLSDYLDGALSAPTRWRIARHVKACPDCARQLAELEDLAAIARARFADSETPVSLPRDVLAALPDPLAQKEVRQMIRRYQAQAAFATAGTLAALTAIGFVALTPILHPTPALADVERAMQGVTTIQWDQIDEISHKSAGWSESFDRKRVRCAVDLGYKAVRIDSSPDSYYVYTAKAGLAVMGKTAQRMPGNNVEFFGRLVLHPSEAMIHTTDGWKSTEETIDGQRRIRFDSEAKYTETESQKWSFWIDPSTRMLVRTQEERVSVGERTVSIRENFRYNQPIPATRFSLELPKGVRYKR